jgi:small multidrug resistance pump
MTIQLPLFIVLAVLLNTTAQVLLKVAGGKGGLLSVWMACAVGAYGISFLLTAKIFARNQISTVGPLMAGATFLCVLAAGVLLFREPLGLQKMAGVGAILVGILLLSAQGR